MAFPDLWLAASMNGAGGIVGAFTDLSQTSWIEIDGITFPPGAQVLVGITATHIVAQRTISSQGTLSYYGFLRARSNLITNSSSFGNNVSRPWHSAPVNPANVYIYYEVDAGQSNFTPAGMNAWRQLTDALGAQVGTHLFAMPHNNTTSRFASGNLYMTQRVVAPTAPPTISQKFGEWDMHTN